ncbi:hypothetical protein DPEC_G00253010 [Dallia pectoralis]|uniref:Uncharacterized protein n=1 Tax=Dallia pectoralis TaxID=75939 RepID=A0ACC2FTJ8_DALPE|nr:hypothetical protein DPEC_G00253010 [Dallia pectoralis]
MSSLGFLCRKLPEELEKEVVAMNAQQPQTPPPRPAPVYPGRLGRAKKRGQEGGGREEWPVCQPHLCLPSPRALRSTAPESLQATHTQDSITIGLGHTLSDNLVTHNNGISHESTGDF